MTSGDPLLMAEIGIITIADFFLLCPDEYTVSKSDNTPFRLEETSFSCSHSVFLSKSTKGDLQASNFSTLTLTTQKNGIRGDK